MQTSKNENINIDTCSTQRHVYTQRHTQCIVCIAHTLLKTVMYLLLISFLYIKCIFRITDLSMSNLIYINSNNQKKRQKIMNYVEYWIIQTSIRSSLLNTLPTVYIPNIVCQVHQSNFFPFDRPFISWLLRNSFSNRCIIWENNLFFIKKKIKISPHSILVS